MQWEVSMRQPINPPEQIGEMETAMSVYSNFKKIAHNFLSCLVLLGKKMHLAAAIIQLPIWVDAIKRQR